MSETMFDLKISPLTDGGFELEQSAGGLEEPDRIMLHPCQVRLLAECAGLLPQPDPTLLDRLHARHIARIHALGARIREVRDIYSDTIIDHCADGIEICLHLDAIEGLALDLIADLGECNAASITPALSGPSNEKSAEISVASSAPKRGRPRKPDALTSTERSKRHREKQGEAPQQQNDLLAAQIPGRTTEGQA